MNSRSFKLYIVLLQTLILSFHTVRHFEANLTPNVLASIAHSWDFNQNVADRQPLGVTVLPDAEGMLNVAFATDRYGQLQSALALTNGYITLPDDVYFSGAFTLTAWVNFQQAASSGRLLSCGPATDNADSNADNVIMSYSFMNHGALSMLTSRGQSVTTLDTTIQFSTAMWVFMAFTLNSDSQASVYIDGMTVNVGPMVTPRPVTRSRCFIGKNSDSELDANTNANADLLLDDMFIFDRGLEEHEVLVAMELNTPNAYQSIAKRLITNRWSFDDSSLIDSITERSLTHSRNVQFIKNRHGEDNAAIYLNYGSLSMPTGVYFSGDFSISAWVNIQSHTYFSRLVECGSSKPGRDSVALILSREETGIPMLQISDDQYASQMVATESLTRYAWTFLVVTLKKNKGTIYFNGEIRGESAQDGLVQPRGVRRHKCFIGKSSHLYVYTMPRAYIDDLVFYNTALSGSHIQTIMTTH